jgi:hypothetical protein
MTYRASIAERIAWTSALRPVEKVVLQALATFANFETGQGAWMGMQKLVARAKLPQRTVERSIRRLVADGWVCATRRHRHATTYDIRIERLATNYVGAKVVSSDPRSVRQVGGQEATDLSATFDDLSAKSGNFDRQLGGPIPSTYPDPELSAPPLRVGSSTDPTINDGRSEWLGGESATQSTPASSDVCANGGDRARRAPLVRDVDARRAGDDARPGRDIETPAPDAGLSLRERPDLPRDQGLERPSAPVGPRQQTLGPLDVSPRPAPQPQWQRLADAYRKGLADAKERKSG